MGPLLGASIGYEFSESFSLLLRQDVSGFGISHGTGFTFTFQISGVWRFGKRKHGLLHLSWR